MGDLIHFTPGSRNDVFSWPIDLHRQQGGSIASYPGARYWGRVEIMHAANPCAFKGTQLLMQAADERPIINTFASRLKHDIKMLSADPARLVHFGRTGRRYIEKCRTIKALSRRPATAYPALGVQ